MYQIRRANQSPRLARLPVRGDSAMTSADARDADASAGEPAGLELDRAARSVTRARADRDRRRGDRLQLRRRADLPRKVSTQARAAVRAGRRGRGPRARGRVRRARASPGSGGLGAARLRRLCEPGRWPTCGACKPSRTACLLRTRSRSASRIRPRTSRWSIARGSRAGESLLVQAAAGGVGLALGAARRMRSERA